MRPFRTAPRKGSAWTGGPGGHRSPPAAPPRQAGIAVPGREGPESLFQVRQCQVARGEGNPSALQIVRLELAERGPAKVFRVVTALGLWPVRMLAEVDIGHGFTQSGRDGSLLGFIGCVTGLG